MSLSPNKPGFRCAQTYPQPQWSVHTRGVPAGVANVKKMWDYRFRGRDICISKTSDPTSLARASTPHSNSLLRDQRGQSLIVNRPHSSCSSYQQPQPFMPQRTARSQPDQYAEACAAALVAKETTFTEYRKVDNQFTRLNARSFTNRASPTYKLHRLCSYPALPFRTSPSA